MPGHLPHARSHTPKCLSLSLSLPQSLSKARRRLGCLFSTSRQRKRNHNDNDEQVPLPPLRYAIHELGPLLHASAPASCSPPRAAQAPTNHQRHVHQSALPTLKSILVNSASRCSHPPPHAQPSKLPRHQPPAAMHPGTSGCHGRPPKSSFSSTSDVSNSDLAPASSTSTLPTGTLSASESSTSARGSADSGLAPSVTSAPLSASDALALAVRTVLSDPTLPSLDHRVSPASTVVKRKSVRIDLEPAIGRAPKYDRSPDPANLSERLRHGRVTAAEHRRVLDEVLVLKKVARESYRKALASNEAEHVPPLAGPNVDAEFSMSLSEALTGSVSDTGDVVSALVATLAEFVVKAAPSVSGVGSGSQTEGHDLDDECVDLGQDGQHAIPGQYPMSPTLAIAQHLYASPVPTPATPVSSFSASKATESL